MVDAFSIDVYEFCGAKVAIKNENGQTRALKKSDFIKLSPQRIAYLSLFSYRGTNVAVS